MSGIVFLKTKMLNKLVTFYEKEIGCDIWMQQEDCVIFRHGNFIFGFCQRDSADTGGLVTFFFESLSEVDNYYERFKKIADAPPKQNDKYNIYHFFADDPEGRKVEFQYFNNPVSEYLAGDDLLLSRRSTRRFKDEPVSDDTLNKVINLSRWAPTSHNTQGYYFKIIKDRDLIKKLSEIRGKSSSPIARSPYAIVICSDPSITSRDIQDACIAAYHFMLSARFYGVGTCWIADMDRDEAKKMLGIPQEHYIATITPFGYPEKLPMEAPERKEREHFIR